MRSEVTVAQYRSCVEAGVCSPPSCNNDTLVELGLFGSGDNTWQSCNYSHLREDHPVNHINWNQLRLFALWVGAELPSEAEWEFAARSRGTYDSYPWNYLGTPRCEEIAINRVPNFCGAGTAPVCSFPDTFSEQGICDLSGNLWEFVLDQQQAEGYQMTPTDGRPYCEGGGECLGFASRIARGGSWLSTSGRPEEYSARVRGGSAQDASSEVHGGRLVRPLREGAAQP